MIEVITAVLALAALALAGACLLLMRRVRDLTISLECLCNNLGGLRQQIGQGEHPHA